MVVVLSALYMKLYGATLPDIGLSGFQGETAEKLALVFPDGNNEKQIDNLAKFIMDEIPGEPSQNQGAVDTAIRLLKKQAKYPHRRGSSQDY